MVTERGGLHSHDLRSAVSPPSRSASNSFSATTLPCDLNPHHWVRVNRAGTQSAEQVKLFLPATGVGRFSISPSCSQSFSQLDINWTSSINIITFSPKSATHPSYFWTQHLPDFVRILAQHSISRASSNSRQHYLCHMHEHCPRIQNQCCFSHVAQSVP